MNMEPSPMRNELRVIDVIRRPFEQDHLMIILTINVPSHVVKDFHIGKIAKQSSLTSYSIRTWIENEIPRVGD